jgi:hypothetical protein
MLNKIKQNIVMAFSSNYINSNKQEEPLKAPLFSVPEETSLTLTREEVEILLVTIRDTTFKGDSVEKVYNLIFKLQQYYTTITR